MTVHRVAPNWAQAGPIQAEIYPRSAEAGPTLFRVGRLCPANFAPKFVESGPKLTEVGRRRSNHWSKSGLVGVKPSSAQVRSSVAPTWPMMAQVWPMPAEFARRVVKLRRVGPDLDRLRPTSAPSRPAYSAKLWARHRRTSADSAPRAAGAGPCLANINLRSENLRARGVPRGVAEADLQMTPTLGVVHGLPES